MQRRSDAERREEDRLRKSKEREKAKQLGSALEENDRLKKEIEKEKKARVSFFSGLGLKPDEKNVAKSLLGILRVPATSSVGKPGELMSPFLAQQMMEGFLKTKNQGGSFKKVKDYSNLEGKQKRARRKEFQLQVQKRYGSFELFFCLLCLPFGLPPFPTIFLLCEYRVQEEGLKYLDGGELLDMTVNIDGKSVRFFFVEADDDDTSRLTFAKNLPVICFSRNFLLLSSLS